MTEKDQPPPDSKDKPQTPRSRSKKTQSEGSRWLAIIILVVTIILSLLFYLRGLLTGANLTLFTTKPSSSTNSASTNSSSNHQPTWTFEK